MEVEYDPSVTTYPKMLDLFWANHDPTLPAFLQSRQYMSAIFYVNEEQLKMSNESKKEAQVNFKKEIQTVIQPSTHFYVAEE